MKHLSVEMPVVKKLIWLAEWIRSQLLRVIKLPKVKSAQTNEFLKPSAGVVLKSIP